ncbi:glycosyltransferase [Pseudoalteromonas sp. SSM20]|uniref:glycosyltransferase n=1 Tax=Pseudoalteromonas sp. SSM20 TaxID=3139394 RepID=UPI003BA9FB7B
MKIAILASSPIPFGAGGAEKLWWGLADNINKLTAHQCELIKVPTKENDFWNLIEGYEFFYNYDLSHFDMVITGKYPAWMVQHPNHHIYMLHCLRGLYDTYHFMNLPDKVSKNQSKEVLAFLQDLENQNMSVEEVFQKLKNLKSNNLITEELSAFPGPFIRKIIHYLDNAALSTIRRTSAISHTVADRKEYYPVEQAVYVNYPPPMMSGFYSSGSDYFFTASRIDGPKRVELILDAYLQSGAEKPLKIAGSGPLLERLKEKASCNSNIEFLGYVSDTELVDYYANALAIIFVPYDEDYGLITIEAMKSGKPVITVNDSGGVTEFVEHGITGLTSEPQIELLAENIKTLDSEPQLAYSMGLNAKKKVTNVNWLNTVGDLLQEKLETASQTKKLDNALVVSTYPFYPPQGGGQNRTFYLYKELAKQMTVNVICLVHESEQYRVEEVAPNLFQIKVPKTQEHAIEEWKISEQAGIPVTDIAFIDLYGFTPDLEKEFKRLELLADLVICNQCYTYPFVSRLTDKAICHDSQNLESKLKEQMLESSEYNSKLIQTVFDSEKQACQESIFTAVCSEEDGLAYKELYGMSGEKYQVIANGVDTNTVKFSSKEERLNHKTKLDIASEKTILFMGSWHQPNIDAVEEIIKLAPLYPSIHFIIIGSVAGYFSDYKLPENLVFAGVVSDEEKQAFLTVADYALNPMFTGSGTNLKMLDYMLSGIPVISTAVGARGLGLSPEMYVEFDFDNFAQCIEQCELIDIEKASRYVEETFDWRVIGSNYSKCLVNI